MVSHIYNARPWEAEAGGLQVLGQSELPNVRDLKRRKMAYEYADERLRINSLRKNTILPKDLQEMAGDEIAALPRDSCPVRIRNRCVMTSRPRGVKRRWRLSRIVFRHLADHGLLSGVQRAIW